MTKQSALYKLYADRLARCSSPDELLKLSREISEIPFRVTERTALLVSLVFIAKHFDKEGKKIKKVTENEVISLDRDDPQ